MRNPRSAAVLPLLVAAVLASIALPGDGERPVSRPRSAHEDLERAEALHAEGSYGLAREIYARLDEAGGLAGAEARWVDFRLADATWRSLAATESSDPSGIERAREALERLVRDAEREDERDRTWAEVEESLGDFWWTRRDVANWGRAWPHYERALGWWAASREIDLARGRYLAIVRRAATPPYAPPHHYYGYYGNQIPLSVLQGARKIALDPTDRAHMAYLVAMGRRGHGADASQVRRTDEAFAEAVSAGRGTSWYDDALYHWAEWLSGSGRVVPLAGGGTATEPDYVRAAELFRRLLREFGEGESRFQPQAAAALRAITSPDLGIAVSNVFLPGSEIVYHANWRNVAEIELALYPVELTGELELGPSDGGAEWVQRLSPGARRPLRQWTLATADAGDHVPGQVSPVVERGLPEGAYLLEARGGGQRAVDLLLVSRAALVLKSSDREALVFACDAIDGSPRAGADVVLWARSYDEVWRWTARRGRTGADGTVRFELPSGERGAALLALAEAGASPSFATSHVWSRRGAPDAWRVYAFTDRPVYRPGETASWKIVARQRLADGGYATPTGRALSYRVVDPRGAALSEGRLELNAFGGAWVETDLAADLPLGPYRVEFEEEDRSRAIGQAVLFRVEEYKLPEFKVGVETPRADGAPRALRAGEAVEAEIVAEYYFGAPVVGADVEVVVHRRPLFVLWSPAREFPWFYEDMGPRSHGWSGPGQVVERVTLTTDEAGRARLALDASGEVDQDFEYTIEARVTDAARREVVGRGTVRASRQRYFAYLGAAHQLHRPGDEVRVELRTQDANEQPLAAEGRLRVTRERWVEVWLDPGGREIAGPALERARRAAAVFPPPAGPGAPSWRPKFRGYEQEQVLDRRVRTGEDGTAEIAFTAAADGFYRVAWAGDEGEPWPVRADTTVWVADGDSTEIGYRQGGVQILVDRDTLRAGRTAPVMISAPVRGAWVLFTVETETIHDVRVVHLEGTVKLLELEVEARHVPNVFLEAALVHDGELLLDSRQVVVPPADRFLDVRVETDREEYLPGEQAELRVRTLDAEGRPVAAEVALALVDDSVFAIQDDLAGDPRRFFFGDKRAKTVATRSTFHERPYVRLERGPDGELTDRRARDGLAENEGAQARFLAGGSAAVEELAARAVPGPARPSAKSVGRQDVRAEAALDMVADEAGAAGGADAAVEVRSDFRATALWRPDVVTDERGEAVLRARLPGSLTTWRATARVAAHDDRFGTAGTAVRTGKPLAVRLQAPRFFVVGDETTLSAVIHNSTDAEVEATASLDVAGLELVAGSTAEATVRLPAGGEARVDWRAVARRPGEATLTVGARAADAGDAMSRSYPVLEHGIEKLHYRSGKVRGDEVRVALDLPAEHRTGSAELVVQVTPSLAVTLLDALPYLIDYPYGCTEQTMSRFLPSAIVAHTLGSLRLDAALVAGRLFGGIEPDHAAATHPDGRRGLDELDAMVRAGLARLYDFQHADGGWGWWKEGDSDPYMSAYVVWGLGLAREAGLDVRRDALDRGRDYLDRKLVEHEELPDMQAWMLHALAASARGGAASPFQTRAVENLWARRDRLNAYTRALFALAAHRLGDGERARVLVRNLENGVTIDRAPDTSVVVRGGAAGGADVVGTAHWGRDGLFRRWSDGAVESTAFALSALLAVDPGNELVEPVTHWLIRNRRGAQWSNTRDTAIAVLALNDYLRRSGELEARLDYELEVNGRSIASRRIVPEDVLAAPSRFAVDPSVLRNGANEVRIVRRGGEGPIYFAAELRFFSLEEPVAPAGHEVFLRREYVRLVPEATLLAGFVEARRALNDRGAATSGERVEVVLTIEAKNDHEYLVVEDLKPAGLEAVGLRSGEPLRARELNRGGAARAALDREVADTTGRTLAVYQELRDRKVALFLDRLPQGLWEIRYELRAETPGLYHALPALIHAMYVPEIRGNGAEIRVRIDDRPR